MIETTKSSKDNSLSRQARQEIQQELQQLLPHARRADAETATLWRAAELITQLRGTSAAAPLYRRILKKEPSHAAAAFALGSLMIAEDNAKGAVLVQKAMQREQRYIKQGLELVTSYLRKHNRLDDAQKFTEKWHKSSNDVPPKPPQASPAKPLKPAAPHIAVRRPLWMGLAFACLIAVIGWTYLYFLPSPEIPIAVSQVPSARPSAPFTRPATTNEYLERLHRHYRLRPDRRFIGALLKLSALMKENKQGTSFNLKYTQDHWQISYNGVHVGSLPEYPDFSDLFTLLKQWNIHLSAEQYWQVNDTPLPAELSKTLQTQIDAFFTPGLTQALASLDRHWMRGGRELAAIGYAVRAMTRMQLQHRDTLESAERISIQALAWLALYRSLGGKDLLPEESLLAYRLGYSSHARQVAQGLAPTNPVRSYIFQQNDALREYVEEHPEDRLGAYLYLEKSAGELPFGQWRAQFERLIGETAHEEALLPAFALLGRLRQFGLQENIAQSTIYAAVLGVEQALLESDPGSLKLIKQGAKLLFELDLDNVHKLMARFLLRTDLEVLGEYMNMRLETLQKRHDGMFLDGVIYGDYFRGFFYSGIYGLGTHYFDSLASIPAADAFAKLLGQRPEGLAGDFQRWFHNLLSVRSRQQNPLVLVREMSSFRYLGGPAMLRLAEEHQRYYSSPDPILLQSTRTLVNYLDSRPTHVARYYKSVQKVLLDKPLAKKLAQHLYNVDVLQQKQYALYLAYLEQDETELFALLDEADTEPATAIYGLNLLQAMDKVEPVRIEEKFGVLAARYPDNFNLTDDYLEFLLEHQYYEKARDVAKRGYEQWQDEPNLIPIIMLEYIAKAYLAEKRLTEAWEVAEVAARSYRSWSMRIAADVLETMNKPAEAEAMLKKILARYDNDPRHVSALAGLYWRQRRYEDAAKLIATVENLSAWGSQVVPSFAKALGAQATEAEILSAYQHIQQEGISSLYLFYLASGLGEAHPAVASQLLDALAGAVGPQERMELILRQYIYRKKAFGEEQAFAWLNSQVPPAGQAILAQLAMREDGAEDLIWRFEPSPQATGQHYPALWLMRMLLYLDESPQDPAHFTRLQDYYQANPTGKINIFGRYLLGMEDEQSLLDTITSPKSEGEAAYYFGQRARYEGRHEEASDWFRITMETGVGNNLEYMWAYSLLQSGIGP